MAQVPVNNLRSVNLPGAPDVFQRVRASPDDFGALEGAALANFGAQMTKVGNSFLEADLRHQDNASKIAFDDFQTNEKLELVKKSDEWDPTQPGFATSYANEAAERGNKFLSSVPEGPAKRDLQLRTRTYINREVVNAAGIDRGYKIWTAKQSIQGKVNNYATSLSADPNEDTFDDVINDVASDLSRSGIPAVERMTIMQSHTKLLMDAVTQGYIDQGKEAEARAFGLKILSRPPQPFSLTAPSAGVEQKDRVGKIDSSPVGAVVDQAIKDTGFSDPALAKIAFHVESSGNPNAVTGPHTGLGMLTQKEFAKYARPGDVITDPYSNARASLLLWKDLAAEFKKTERRDPTGTELYLLHQQGPAGLKALMANPEKSAMEALRDIGVADPKKHIWGNLTEGDKARFPGGAETVKASEFLAIWGNRIQGVPIQKARVGAWLGAVGGTKGDDFSYLVTENQANEAQSRKLPITGELKTQMGNAAAQAGVRVIVYSGGQHPAGSGQPRTGSTRHDTEGEGGRAADIRLAANDGSKRILNSDNPEDRKKIAAFITAVTAQGATGVGHAAGYMGPEGIHVGGGKPGVWGTGETIKGAPDWVIEAYNKGVEARGGTAVASRGGGDQYAGNGQPRGAVIPFSIRAETTARGMRTASLGSGTVSDAPTIGIGPAPIVGDGKAETVKVQPARTVVDPSDYETKLSEDEEAKFQEWLQKHAPGDSGEDYDYRGAFKEGMTPGEDGHWSDKYKKPNHPTFSDESIYAKDVPENAGHWEDGKYVPPAGQGSGTDAGGNVKVAQADTGGGDGTTATDAPAGRLPVVTGRVAGVKAVPGTKLTDPNGVMKSIEDRIAQKRTAERAEFLRQEDEQLKKLYALEKDGKLTRDGIDSVKHLITAQHYLNLLNLLDPDAEKRADDDDTVIEIERNIDKMNPDEFQAWLAPSLKAQKIKGSTYTAASSRNREYRKDDHPQSPYREARGYIDVALNPGQLVSGPANQAARFSQANGLREFTDWSEARGGKYTRKEAMDEAERIVESRAIISFRSLKMTHALSRYFPGGTTRQNVSPDAVKQGILNLGRLYDEGKVPEEEYQTEIKRLEDWGTILNRVPGPPSGK